MENDSYECPRCHNVFPAFNKIMHDARCTVENPMALDKSRIQNLEENPKEEKKEEKKVEVKEEKKFVEEKKEEIKPPQNQIRKPPSGEFPEVFECNICHQVLMESERKDHMFCHNLEKEENNRANNFEASQEEINRQRAIERQIERNNRMSQQNNERSNEGNNIRNNENNNNRNNNRNNFPFFPNLGNSDINFEDPNSNSGLGNFLNNLGNAISRQQMSSLNNLGNNRTNNNRTSNNNQNRNNTNVRSNVVMEYITYGPNGERIVRRYNNNGGSSGSSGQEQMPPFMFNFSSRGGNRRNISFNEFNDLRTSGLFDNFLNEFLQRMGNHENPTDQDILNELPETEIEDVNKLDQEKRNCIICLEDFKNGDKAIILPCIHLFHTECIKNWLKTQNTCPICKFKLTGENLNPSVDDMH